MQLNVRHNQLLDLTSPKVMAIVNITPDSFYTAWGQLSEDELLKKISEVIEQGADILDLGSHSTRPGHTPISAEEEWQRLAPALRLIRNAFPNSIISIDTYQSDVATKAIDLGADMINNVYGGCMNEDIYRRMAHEKVPYILTHSLEYSALSDSAVYDYTMSQLLDFFQSQLDRLHRLGMADVIVDPGFGFGKTEKQNYTILEQLNVLSYLRAPILVGLSRKSMLYKPLQTTPEHVLPATVAAHMVALERGANILRVHDVAAAKQAITVYTLTHLAK
jgi:dihydropteroate synthase